MKYKPPIWIPHKYQIKCISKGFDTPGLGLFLDPGLGKTSIMLALFKMLKLYGLVDRMLVVAPLRVCYLVWPLETKEWANFQDLTVNVLHGKKKQLNDADIQVINPEGLTWLVDQLGDTLPFQMLVCDESTLFKNHKSMRTKIMKKLSARFERRYILTGTPVPNTYLGLFSQIYIIDKGEALGTRITSFREQHFVQIGNPKHQRYKIKKGEAENINKRIAKKVIRLSAEDYLDLPPLVNNRIYVELPLAVRKTYNELKDEFCTEIEGGLVTPMSPASVGHKLRQVCGGFLYEEADPLAPLPKHRPYYKLHTVKIDALKELIEGLGGKPLLVAYWYKHEAEQLKTHFKNAVFVESGADEKTLLRYEKEWNAGRTELMFVQPQTFAHGINLQRAGGDLCWYSIIYDFELYDQLIARLWRQGAVKRVVNHFLIAKDTVDEAIFSSLVAKKRNQDSFFAQLLKNQKE